MSPELKVKDQLFMCMTSRQGRQANLLPIQYSVFMPHSSIVQI